MSRPVPTHETVSLAIKDAQTIAGEVPHSESNKDLAIRIGLQAVLMVISHGIGAAVAYWNRGMAEVAEAEAAGLEITPERQAEITAEIEELGDPVMRVDPGDGEPVASDSSESTADGSTGDEAEVPTGDTSASG